MMQSLVNMFWQGSLSSLEVYCIQSFLDKGINVNVFSYDELELPPGASLLDASQILPKEKLFYFAGSPSGFSNIFRYKLLLERGGWWVDADVVMLGDKLPESDHFWAREDSDYINGAVLHFPPRDSRCEELLFQSTERAKTLDAWGVLGPKLLTKVLANESVRNDGTTENTYPIHWLEVHYLWFPEFAEIVENRIKNACFLHLWQSMFARMGIDLRAAPPRGGIIDKFVGIKEQVRLDSPDTRRAVHNYVSADWVSEYSMKTLGRTIEPPVLCTSSSAVVE